MTDEKNYKVLSIDGGGIKGLYSAYILKHLKEEFDINIYEYFDLFCGTSTGGIIALALANEISIEKIIGFYKKEGPKIFLSTDNWVCKLKYCLKQLFWYKKYSNDKLKAALKEVFEDKKIGDLKKDICIPAVKLSNQELTIFKRDHSPELSLHNKIPLYKVALATSAAPTYFPTVKIEETKDSFYVDGGLGANDPALIGAIEASKYHVDEIKGEEFDLLSISSVNDAKGWTSKKSKKIYSLKWLKKMFGVTSNVQSKLNYKQLQFLQPYLPCNSYIKFPSPDLSQDQRKCIDLDCATQEAIKTLGELAYDVWSEEKNNENIRDFFNDNV